MRTVTQSRNDYPGAAGRQDTGGWVLVSEQTGGVVTEPYCTEEFAEGVRQAFANREGFYVEQVEIIRPVPKVTVRVNDSRSDFGNFELSDEDWISVSVDDRDEVGLTVQDGKLRVGRWSVPTGEWELLHEVEL